MSFGHTRADAAETADFLVDRVRTLAGHRWYQGRRTPPLAFTETCTDPPSLRLLAEHRLCTIGHLETRALIAWAGGTRDAVLCRRLLDPRELVELQARGRRCVALLAEVPPQEALTFALHDLRHLEKFFDPAHHAEQIGFFRMFARALATPASEALDRELDPTWQTERDRVLADMNGSPIFLFAVLKMKLKVAVRRVSARALGAEPPPNGALDDAELAAYAPIRDRWLATLDLPSPVFEAARAISARRDHPDNARTLLAYWRSAAG